MTNLLLLGTTNYGISLKDSDKRKFKELSDKFNVHVVTFGPINEKINHGFVTINYVKQPKKNIHKYIKFYFLNFSYLSKYITKSNIEIISAKDPIAAFIPVLIKKYKKINLRVVIEHHGDYLNLLLNQRNFFFPSIITFILKKVANFTYNNCDLIRGVEEKFTADIGKKYNQKYIFFPAWVDYVTFKNNNLSRSGYLFVGNVIPRKGVLFIIKNFDRFTKLLGTNEKLIIAGGTPNREYLIKCQEYIKKNNIKNIEFIGERNPNEIAKLMNTSRLLLMASNFEGLPRVLIESGLCGLPSLASNIQGIRSIC